MFEHGPFRTCPNCGADKAFGILHVLDNRLRRRCTRCRHAKVETFPALDKKVIYLDQLALSEVFKVRTGKMATTAPHYRLWSDLSAAIEDVLLYQQAIFPASNIHLTETIVSKHAGELRRAYEALGGGVIFWDDVTLEHRQVLAFAAAFADGAEPPALGFAIDEALMGKRNAWLPTIRVSVNADYDHLAADIRAARNASADTMKEIAQRWAKEKPTFAEAVAEEINEYGPAHRKARKRAALRIIEQGGSIAAVMDAALSQSNVLHVHLREFFLRRGAAPDEVDARIDQFLDWNGLASLPTHRIGVYMFAGLARKMAAGQKRLPSRGMLNDVKVISTYAPYVDAMFVDNECAALLSEEPLKSDLDYRAEIFSLNTAQRFLDYLRALRAAASPEVEAAARELYGLN